MALRQEITSFITKGAKLNLGPISKFIGLIYCRENEEFPADFICSAHFQPEKALTKAGIKI